MKRKYGKLFTQPTLAQQHSKDQVDINNIMKRYIKSGVLDHVAKYQPQYTENNETDYHSAMNTVIKADEMFSELPAQARKHFNNDPAAFLAHVSDPANHDTLHELGLTTGPTSPPAPRSPPPPTSGQTTEQKPTQSESAPAAIDP